MGHDDTHSALHKVRDKGVLVKEERLSNLLVLSHGHRGDDVLVAERVLQRHAKRLDVDAVLDLMELLQVAFRR